MSLIKIRHSIPPDFPVCKVCLLQQLMAWRMSIKEQWNAFNQDGKTGMVFLNFDIRDDLLWDEAIVNDLCITHTFRALNETTEAMGQMQKGALELPGNVSPAFLKNIRSN